MMRSVLITKYYLGDQITQNEMGWASGTYGKEGRYYGVLVGKPRERAPL